MTAKEIAAKLEVLLSRYYVDPKVNVRLLGHASKKYYVHGQVGAQGPRAYTGRDTLVDAVLTSNVNFLSWTSRVTVTRPTHGDTPALRHTHRKKPERRVPHELPILGIGDGIPMVAILELVRHPIRCSLYAPKK